MKVDLPSKLAANGVERLRRLQRRLAGAQSGSPGARVKTAIAGPKSREADRRKDWVQKTTADLARCFDVIRVEDLTIAGMTRSAGGTIAEPGRGVQAMAGLNRGILSGGWSATLTRLDQMAPGRVEKVNLGYTSQTRNAGKHLARESRNNQADFKRVACEHLDKADLFATRNITETAGTARPDVAAPGDRVRLARSVTSEPQLVAS